MSSLSSLASNASVESLSMSHPGHNTSGQVDAEFYYGNGNGSTSGSGKVKDRHGYRTRTYSANAGGFQVRKPNMHDSEVMNRSRRLSHDEASFKPRKFLIDVEETMRIVLEQEDTDGNFQISVTDSGPKVLALGTVTSNAYRTFDIRGTYMLSNLLQELALAKDYGRKHIVLDEARLTENPVDRLSRMIRNLFWNGLTRRIDGDGLEAICADPKNRSKQRTPRIYVPIDEPEMYEYYKAVAAEKPHLNLQVDLLPRDITAEYTKSLNDKPGILALAMEKVKQEDGTTKLQGIPFVVPGARFNELYNWDSYFIALGLLIDGKVDLARGIVDHFCFEIRHYGKILNGNRSYYLMRSQPCFLTDLALQVYTRLDPSDEEANTAWLRNVIKFAIQEYHTVWMADPRLDPVSGLTRFRPDGLGIPPETEASHFTHILQPYADKHGISVNEFIEQYDNGDIKEPELDTYFLHDRAVRESGHDTTYRFEKRCANLATIDLNSLLFKYEIDIATAIRDVFDDKLDLEAEYTLSAFPFGTEIPYDGDYPSQPSQKSTSAAPQTSDEWFARAERRKQLIDHYLWNEGKGLFFDYDTAKRTQSVYETVTAFWALWAGCATDEQADKLARKGLPKFEVAGGLVAGTEESRGPIGLDRPNRQWDYPCAWPPHQMLAWIGLSRYSYDTEASRLAYRWLYMILHTFVGHSGAIVEKLDAVNLSHNVDAEYGNQGIDFVAVPREGFGWMNSSFELGLTFINQHQRRALGALTTPETFYRLTAKTAKK